MSQQLSETATHFHCGKIFEAEIVLI
jgi:hypothetical protein